MKFLLTLLFVPGLWAQIWINCAQDCRGFYYFDRVAQCWVPESQIFLDENLGRTAIKFYGNDFPNASPENPVYLKIQLPDKAVLAQTLVGLEGDSHSEPIQLALMADVAVTAPEDTLTIVRCIKGETGIWIKVTSSTRTWLESGAPKPEDNVTAVFGYTGKESWVFGAYHQAQVRNLPYNTCSGRAASTLISMDLGAIENNEVPMTLSVMTYQTQSNLRTTPSEDLLELNLLKAYEKGASNLGQITSECSTGQSDQWIMHVTGPESDFETQLTFLNPFEEPLTIRLQPLNQDGQELSLVAIDLGPSEIREFNAWQVLDNPETTHFYYEGSGRGSVSVAYRHQSDGARTDLLDQSEESFSFLIEPADWDYVFEGLVALNSGTETLDIEVRVLDPFQEVQSSFSWVEGLIPMARTVGVLDQLLTKTPEGHVVQLLGSHAFRLMLLRGTRPGVEPSVLYPSFPMYFSNP